MNAAADIIIGAIKAQVCGKQYHIVRDISDEVLKEAYKLSKRHDVAHIVAAELLSRKMCKTQELVEKFKQQQIIALYRYERINYELIETCRVLDESNIPHMPLKGSVMRQYYPEPWMRTSSDIDILVKSEDIPAATDALVSNLGYQNKGTNEHDVQLFAPSGVHLELHFATVEDYRLPAANKVLETIWTEHAICTGGQHYAMSNEMFYFYHVAHMAKHFQEGGCGIRFFLDMWLLNRSVKCDNDKKDALLRKGELVAFAENAEHLSEVWFGDRAHDDITRRMEAFILTGGVYGSADNKMAIKHVHKGGRLGYAMYLVFRPYHELKGQYRILYKYKWLFPFCQVHRWICLPFNGGLARAKQSLNRGANAYEKTGDSVEQMLKDLNLNGKT